MAFVAHARASALPTRDRAVLPPSPLRRLSTLASTRGNDVAFLVATGAGVEARSWSQVETTVQRAAAGLIRSGMRTDQVVLSLLPSAHPHPELEIALRAIGAVVVHVSPEAPTEDLVRELSGVDVRLVVSQDEAELDRLAGLRFPSAEMLDLGDDSWSRLLAIGAERLVMDPDVVHRLDRVVDPEGTVARLLPPGSMLSRIASEAESHLAYDELLPHDGVTVLVGEHVDAFVHLVRDAHLACGGTLAHLASPDELSVVLEELRPAALALAPGAAPMLAEVVSSVTVPGARRLRPARARAANAVALRAWLGAGLQRVVGMDLPDDVRDSLRACDVEVVTARPGALLPPDLPEPAPVVMGDVADLPRRSRGEPGRDFGLRLDRSLRAVDEPEESAFVLPSLPLFGGESFLDKLLMQQARQAEQ